MCREGGFTILSWGMELLNFHKIAKTTSKITYCHYSTKFGEVGGCPPYPRSGSPLLECLQYLVSIRLPSVYSTVPELRSRYSKLERYTKLRRQVKQARLPKWPLHWMGLHIYYNGFSSTRMNYGQDF